MAEPCILAGLFITLSMLLPLAFPCTPTHCIIVQGQDLPRCPAGESDHMRYVAICVSSGDCWAGKSDHTRYVAIRVSSGDCWAGVFDHMQYAASHVSPGDCWARESGHVRLAAPHA